MTEGVKCDGKVTEGLNVMESDGKAWQKVTEGYKKVTEMTEAPPMVTPSYAGLVHWWRHYYAPVNMPAITNNYV